MVSRPTAVCISCLLRLRIRTHSFVFFFQAEDGIRDVAVTGVQTCALPIYPLNLRLHPHEIAAIAKHAGDRFLLVDDVLYPIYEQFREDASFERVIVVPYGFNTVAEGFLNYEELLAASRDDFRYPAIDENDGAAMCFTSGTTGFSKGVIYSHRALVLHSFCCGLVEVLGLSEADTVLPVAPMFHANAWGIPFAATMLGARLVLPGPHVDPESILGLLVNERVTIACGVPTVWIAVLDALEKKDRKSTRLNSSHGYISYAVFCLKKKQ